MVKMPQTMINIRMPNDVDLKGNKNVQSAVSHVESSLGKNGRVLLRPSGTEPLVRVMVEGKNPDQVGSLAKELAQAVAEEFGASL
jgi:phosphoglucosamine mutase